MKFLFVCLLSLVSVHAFTAYDPINPYIIANDLEPTELKIELVDIVGPCNRVEFFYYDELLYQHTFCKSMSALQSYKEYWEENIDYAISIDCPVDLQDLHDGGFRGGGNPRRLRIGWVDNRLQDL